MMKFSDFFGKKQDKPTETFNYSDVTMLNGIYNKVAQGIVEMKNISNMRDTFYNQLIGFDKEHHMGNFNFGFYNQPQGVGGKNDFSAFDQRTTAPYLNYNILDAYYRTSWACSSVIDIPAEDMTKRWRKFIHKDPKVVEARENAEKFYKIKSLIQETVQWSDLYGGAGIIWSLDTDTPYAISSQFKVSQVRQGSLQFFHTVIKDQAMPSGAYQIDPFMSEYLRPDFYSIAASGSSSQVHRDRLIIFTGRLLPVYSRLQNALWGDSKLTPLLKLLDRTESMWIGIDQLFRSANVDVIKLKGYANILAKTPEKLRQRLGLDQNMISNWNKMLMDTEDEYSRNELGSLTGLSDVMKTFLQLVSGASGIPFSRFLGESMKGFSDGANEMITYYEKIQRKQQAIEDQLGIIDKIIEMSIFGELKGITYEWPSLITLSENEKSDVDVKKAQRDQIYLDSGIVTPRDVANNLMLSDTYPTITSDRLEEYSDEFQEEQEDLSLDNEGNDENENASDNKK